MRSFSFTAKNIGRERYLTYTMGEGCELDEDVLDICEENDIKELVKVMFEEDDDYDYLTYDVTGKMALGKFVNGTMTKEKVFKILRNVALSFVNCKEQAIPLAYLLLHKDFMYINPDTLGIQFICLPVESKGSVSAEFKSFARQFLANLKYDVEEDLSFVGQLLTYINGDSFNLRGLIGLSEALMEDSGIEFEEEEGIATDDGSEIVSAAEEPVAEEKSGISDFMSDLGDSNEPLPEINFDDEDEEEEAEEEPVAEPIVSIDDSEPVVEEAEEPAPETPVEEEEPVAEEPVTETTEEEAPEVASEEETSEEEESVEEIPEEEMAEEPAEEEISEEEAVEEEAPAPEVPKKAESFEEIKARLEQLVGGAQSVPLHPAKPVSEEELDDMLDNRPKVKKNVVRVNRAALIQSNAETEEDTSVAELSNSSKNSVKENGIESINDSLNADASITERKPADASADDSDRPIKSASILSKGATSVNNTMLGSTGTLKICPYIVRVNTEERVMITKQIFKIGKANRGNDYTVDGNGHISRQHAIIIQRDGVCYIKDNKSTNHTYVNGKEVAEGTEEVLTHDCKLILGDEEFLFKLR